MSRQQEELKLIACMEYFFSRKVIALIPRSTWRSLETSQGAKLDMLYAELTPEEKAKLRKCRHSEFWKGNHLDTYLTYTARQLADLHPHLMDTITSNHNTNQLKKHKKLYREIKRNLPAGTAHTIENLIFRNWAGELGPLVVKKQQVAQEAEQRAARLAKKTGNSQMGFRVRKSRKSSRKRKASRKTSRKRRSAKRKTSRKRRSAKRKASRKRSRKRRSS